MSATSQLTTFLDLATDLQNRVRVTTGVTATETQAKRYVNIALQDTHLGFEYKVPWAERRAILRTQGPYTTGTITVFRGSQNITGTGTSWTATTYFNQNVRAGGKMTINGSRVPYKIATVPSGTTGTLEYHFTEADVADGSYVYYEDEYDLATDFLRPVDLQKFSEAMSIDLISRTEARRYFPSNTQVGKPTMASIVDYAPVGNTTPIRRVQLYPPPNDWMLIPYSYITSNLATSAAGAAQANLSADTDEPIMPLRYRHALVYHALAAWYRDKKDDSRSQEAKAEYTDIMLRIALDQDIGAPRPQIRPRVGPYVRSAKRPYSGSGQRYDVNGRFDRME